MLMSACMLLPYSGSEVKISSNITPAQKMNSGHRLIMICHFSEVNPATLHGQQRRRQCRWNIGYSQVGQSFPFHLKTVV
jgi:hypothetical protein